MLLYRLCGRLLQVWDFAVVFCTNKWHTLVGKHLTCQYVLLLVQDILCDQSTVAIETQYGQGGIATKAATSEDALSSDSTHWWHSLWQGARRPWLLRLGSNSAERAGRKQNHVWQWLAWNKGLREQCNYNKFSCGVQPIRANGLTCFSLSLCNYSKMIYIESLIKDEK